MSSIARHGKAHGLDLESSTVKLAQVLSITLLYILFFFYIKGFIGDFHDLHTLCSSEDLAVCLFLSFSSESGIRLPSAAGDDSPRLTGYTASSTMRAEIIHCYQYRLSSLKGEAGKRIRPRVH